MSLSRFLAALAAGFGAFFVVTQSNLEAGRHHMRQEPMLDSLSLTAYLRRPPSPRSLTH